MHPRCPDCGRSLPNFSVTAEEAAVKDFQVLGVTFHLQCSCGTMLDMQKGALHTG